MSYSQFLYNFTCTAGTVPTVATVKLLISQIGAHLGCVFRYTESLRGVLVKRANHLKKKMRKLTGGAPRRKFFQQSWTLAVCRDEVVAHSETIKKLENNVERLKEQVSEVALQKCEVLAKKIAATTDKLRMVNDDGVSSTQGKRKSHAEYSKSHLRRLKHQRVSNCDK